MKQHIYQTLVRTGAPRWLSWLNRHKVVILMYHGFGRASEMSGLQNRHGLHVDVDVFRRQLEHLRAHYQVIPLQTVVDHCREKRPLPPRSVVITMDDGYRSNYSLAFPLLREFGMPATIFLGTEFVDEQRHQWNDRLEYALDRAPREAVESMARERVPGGNGDHGPDGDLRGRLLDRLKDELKSVPQERRAASVDEIESRLDTSLAADSDPPQIYQALTWPQVHEMMVSGLVDFGSHTVSHFILSRCETDVIQREVADAKALIESRMGAPCPLFCYPNGGLGDFDARTRAAVQEAGHTCALTTVLGSNDENADVFELKRLGVMSQQPYEHFVVTMTGLAQWMADLRGAGR